MLVRPPPRPQRYHSRKRHCMNLVAYRTIRLSLIQGDLYAYNFRPLGLQYMLSLLRFYVILKIQKKRDFVRLLALLHTFSRTMPENREMPHSPLLAPFCCPSGLPPGAIHPFRLLSLRYCVQTVFDSFAVEYNRLATMCSVTDGQTDRQRDDIKMPIIAIVLRVLLCWRCQRSPADRVSWRGRTTTTATSSNRTVVSCARVRMV